VHRSARSAGRRLNAAREEFLSITPARFLKRLTFQRVMGVQDAGSGSDSRTGIPVRRTPARAVDALRLGPRWLAHQPRDARALYEMPEPAGSRTSGEQLGPTREKLESQAWTLAGAGNALRLALRRQTHG
jgi:hypothetical protein